MGAYSYYPSKAFSKISFFDLVKPVENIFFAGEALNYKYSGYVHGAYLSGEKTAKDILSSKELKEVQDGLSGL